jgi:hypothetical protein
MTDAGKLTYREISEYKAKVPPSPSSSALNTIKTYLTVTMIVKAQMMRDVAPSTSSWLGLSLKVDEKTYKGLVPMSPYMTPRDW